MLVVDIGTGDTDEGEVEDILAELDGVVAVLDSLELVHLGLVDLLPVDGVGLDVVDHLKED
jgi:hypothetical protein